MVDEDAWLWMYGVRFIYRVEICQFDLVSFIWREEESVFLQTLRILCVVSFLDREHLSEPEYSGDILSVYVVSTDLT